MLLDVDSGIKTLPYRNYIEPSLDAEGGMQREGGHRASEDLPPFAIQSKSIYSGILPIAKSSDSEWSLVGHGKSYSDCGTLRFRGCLNIEEHYHALDRNQSGKAFVQGYKRSCARKECPICHESWAGLEAGRVEYRLKAYGGRKWHRPIHLSVSPEPDLWNIDYETMRKEAYKVLKKVGIVGGSIIFHPFREKCCACGSTKDFESKLCEKCGFDRFEWYFSPHFHVIGYGWHSGFVKNWVIRNHGVRKSVHATIMYQLSHAGVNEKYHTITWFGALAYNKLKIEPLLEEKNICPLCKHDLVPLFYVGEGIVPPPDVEGDYFLDSNDWRESHIRYND